MFLEYPKMIYPPGKGWGEGTVVNNEIEEAALRSTFIVSKPDPIYPEKEQPPYVYDRPLNAAMPKKKPGRKKKG